MVGFFCMSLVGSAVVEVMYLIFVLFLLNVIFYVSQLHPVNVVLHNPCPPHLCASPLFCSPPSLPYYPISPTKKLIFLPSPVLPDLTGDISVPLSAAHCLFLSAAQAPPFAPLP